MNYQKIYDSIIYRAKQEELSGTRKRKNGNYYERHHIVPKCLGGTDDKDNLVLLTAREHFLCHWLLIRIYPENRGIAIAFWMMCNCKSKRFNYYIPSSRMYAEAKELRSKLGMSEETKQNLKSRIVSEETKNKIRNARKYQVILPKTLEQRQKTIDTKRALGKLAHSEETKRRISESKLGISLPPFTDEHKRKIRERLKGRIYDKHVCPYCNKLVAHCSRYHFDKCKFKPGNEHVAFIFYRTKKECPHCNLIVYSGNRSHFDNCKLKPGYVYVKKNVPKMPCTYCNKTVAKGNRYHFENCKNKHIFN
jgi:endogenous inhibitor of DNA gyrase (YacG/DUF329 family)